MKKSKKLITPNNPRQLGASLVEYALLLALVALIAIPAVDRLGWASRLQNCRASGGLGADVPEVNSSVWSVMMGASYWDRKNIWEPFLESSLNC